MEITKPISHTLVINNVITFSTNVEKYIRQALNAKFTQKIFSDMLITSVSDIIWQPLVACLGSDKGTIDVTFAATGIVYSMGDVIPVVNVNDRREKSIICSADGIQCFLDVVNKFIVVGTSIPVRLTKVSYRGFTSSVIAICEVLKCDTLRPTYHVTGSIHWSTIKSLANNVKNELILREQTYDHNFQQFENMLLATGNGTDTNMTIEYGEYKWIGPSFADTVTNVFSLETIEGYWRRPLTVYQSCPVIVEAEISTDAIEIRATAFITQVLYEVYSYLRLIRGMAEYYTGDKFDTNIAVWEYIKRSKET